MFFAFIVFIVMFFVFIVVFYCYIYDADRLITFMANRTGRKAKNCIYDAVLLITRGHLEQP